MTNGTDDHDEFTPGLGAFSDSEGDEQEPEEPTSYHSGRVRIIGAEPAGDAVREVTGPVEEGHPELPHWNDAPTGQVPAILDRSTGEESAVAPPTWREEDNDWEAQEEVFEPSMLSGDLPAVGALLDEQQREEADADRQPWHFESDDTLVIPPEPDLEPDRGALEPPPDPDFDTGPRRRVSAAPRRARQHVEEPQQAGWSESEAAPANGPAAEPEHEPVGMAPRVASAETAAASAVAASRLSPPEPPEPKVRAPRTSRANGTRTGNVPSGGTSGRDMRVAIGSGVLIGVIGLACFAAGTVATLVISTVIVLLATAEGYAAFRRAQYHPATLLGLVAVLSLMIETYNKGVAALPLVLVLLVAGSFVWYLARVEPAADPASGMLSTVFIFVWVGAFGSFAALLLNPNLFPDRHGIAFILAAVIVTVTDDVASLLVGSAMGRHQLAPSISPNKSWEGLIGGALAAILVSVVVVHFIHPWTVSKALVYGVVVAIVAPLGDLSQSMIKRHLGLKDMGRLVPGHGGVLDRFDGLLFVLPATYFVVKALHLG
ncbi:MAG TPA: phosphatidate cytidylyltransferase [Acidimicrobiales bacterium]|jgi:CDP-diglyceride synthetase|nr:phosphatidate cytidylyltransferase [Acidimicrobiales bacterium]